MRGVLGGGEEGPVGMAPNAGWLDSGRCGSLACTAHSSCSSCSSRRMGSPTAAPSVCCTPCTAWRHASVAAWLGCSLWACTISMISTASASRPRQARASTTCRRHPPCRGTPSCLIIASNACRAAGGGTWHMAHGGAGGIARRCPCQHAPCATEAMMRTMTRVMKRL